MSALKPCPFCGGGAHHDGDYCVCDNPKCDAFGPGPMESTAAESANLWNTRPAEAELLEALRDVTEEYIQAMRMEIGVPEVPEADWPASIRNAAKVISKHKE